MKTKFYFLITLVFLTFAVSAQKYKVMLVQSWVNNSWSDTMRTTSTYDSNGHLIKLITEEWDPATNTWGNAIMISYTLNSDNTIKETLTQVWDKTNNTWQDIVTTFTYSASKKKLTATNRINFSGIDVDYSKTTYTYNDKDSLATQLDQTFNQQTLQLANSSQTTFAYNSDGALNQHVTQTWTTDQWVNSVRETNTYNASKKATSSLGEKWVNNAWENDSRYTFTYSAAGSITESLTESWLNNAWANTSLVKYTYNATNKIEQIVTQNWNTALAQWDNESRISYDLSTAIDPVQLVGKGSVVYPNPFEDQITIESSSPDEHGIQVFNAVGQLIQSIKTNKSVTNLNLGGMEKGVYFMKIKTAKNEQTIKLLKAR